MNPADLIQELRDAARVTAWHEKRLEADLYRRAADTLASKDTALAEIRAELAEVDEANRMLVKSADGWRDKFRAAEFELALVKKALEPFAAQAATHAAQIPDEMFIDDYEQPANVPWKSAAGITVGHLRAASRALSQDGEERS